MAAKDNPTIVFPEWAPDVTAIGTGVSPEISGVVPMVDGYGPFQSLQDLTAALPARCRGYFFARKSDGSIAVYAGTATRLYLLDNTLFTWGDVSKGGVAYSTVVPGAQWQFAQFNDFVIAVQVNTVPQKFVLSAGVTFVDLGGSPPQAGFVAIINRFVVLTGLLSNNRRIQWCDLDGPETWTAGTGLADFQDEPDGGSTFGLSGGDAYGVLFQQESIRTLVYAPGSAVTFQITRIATQDPLFAPYSVINAGTRTFFCSAQGFKVIEAGGQPKPIGKGRVDEFFFANVDTSSLELVIGATDPTATRVYWAFKSLSVQTMNFDMVLCYDWSIGENGRWTVLPVAGEYLAALSKPGLTLEQLDAIAPTPLNITGAANNGAGRIRLTLNALSNANFSLGTVGNPSQNFIVVYGIPAGSTTEANGSWRYNIIDATHIDLTLDAATLAPSVFTNAWTSGGHIGGSLDALPFSLDSISKASIASLAAVSSTHKLGVFSGPAIEAILETSEVDLEGAMAFISGIRPMTDSPDALISIGMRSLPKASVSYSAETAINDMDGMCPQLVETRYAKARMRIPAESVWTFARGVQPESQLAGDM